MNDFGYEKKILCLIWCVFVARFFCFAFFYFLALFSDVTFVRNTNGPCYGWSHLKRSEINYGNLTRFRFGTKDYNMHSVTHQSACSKTGAFLKLEHMVAYTNVHHKNTVFFNFFLTLLERYKISIKILKSILSGRKKFNMIIYLI